MSYCSAFQVDINIFLRDINARNDAYTLSRCAFIEHRTSKQTKRNLKRRIDHRRLGRECFIQYACVDQSSSSVSCYRVLNERTIAVTKIPQHVTKYELHSVFENGVIMRYCPVRIASQRGKAPSNFESNKLETG